MRWDLLFDDLASQLDVEQRAEERALSLEEHRLRLSRLSLRDRLRELGRAAADTGVRLQLRGGLVLTLCPGTFGRDWVSGELVERAPARSCVLPLASIATVMPERGRLGDAPGPADPEPPSSLADRITLSFVLRDLSRRRTPVALTTEDGELHGTLDRVARDHLDLALHEPGVARRDEHLQGYRIVPFDRVRLVTFR